MLVTDGQGLPLGLHLDSAQKAEVSLAETALATVRVPRQRGRPRTRPRQVTADKGYDSDGLRRRLRRRGIRPAIPRIRRRGARQRRGRPEADVRPAYRRRWIIERTFAWLGW